MKFKTVFPTLGSTQDVLDLAKSRIPQEYQNEVYTLLMTYHNSLLMEMTHG